MNVVVDENIPLRTNEWLRQAGHVVTDTRQPPFQGSSDDMVWATAQEQQAIVITPDKGFTARWAEAHWGILVVRLRQPNRQKIHDRVVIAMKAHSPEQWPGLLCVMRDQVMSVRRAPRRPAEPS